ncbi:hypothetical protein D9M71_713150 [compost metagenome]
MSNTTTATTRNSNKISKSVKALNPSFILLNAFEYKAYDNAPAKKQDSPRSEASVNTLKSKNKKTNATKEIKPHTKILAPPPSIKITINIKYI